MKGIVRESKYRHIHGETVTKTKYDDLRTSPKATEGYGIKTNGKYFAVAWDAGGGGAVAPILLSKPGRQPRDLPLLTGHTGPVLDFDFNPFNDDQIVTCGEDLTIKVWQMPEDGLKAHMKEPVASLEGCRKKITLAVYNPVAEGILASTDFNMSTKVWNLENQAEAFQIDIPEQAWSVKWNWTGNLLAVASKDKMMHIIDPRQQKIAVSTKTHDGAKGAKIQWIGTNNSGDECNKIITTGFSSQAQRQIMVWDVRKFGAESKETSDPLTLLELDNGTGALYPHWDDGTMTFWVAGKGDGNVRYFESVAEDPYLHFINQFGNSSPQKGFAFFPKKACDTRTHEVMRGLKLENTSVVPISFTVPRKSDAFQDDIFPDGPAGVPALGAEKWEGGTDAPNPITQSMKPGANKAESSVVKAAPVSVKELKSQLAEAQARIEALEKENAVLKAQVATLTG